MTWPHPFTSLDRTSRGTFMPLRWLAAASFMLIPISAASAERFYPSDIPSNSSIETIWRQVAVEPAEFRLAVGDKAPGFSYLDPKGKWNEFKSLGAGSPMLLVFGASDSDLVALERLRSMFEELGVTPVAVMDGRGASARALQRKLSISVPIITDPKRAIAGLFNSLDPKSLTLASSFFVLDENRQIRALSHGELPSPQQMLALSANSLGLPLPKSWSHVSS
jgi:peroxiredoxin